MFATFPVSVENDSEQGTPRLYSGRKPEIRRPRFLLAAQPFHKCHLFPRIWMTLLFLLSHLFPKL